MILRKKKFMLDVSLIRGMLIRNHRLKYLHEGSVVKAVNLTNILMITIFALFFKSKAMFKNDIYLKRKKTDLYCFRSVASFKECSLHLQCMNFLHPIEGIR
jgi:hypothetical protein